VTKTPRAAFRRAALEKGKRQKKKDCAQCRIFRYFRHTLYISFYARRSTINPFGFHHTSIKQTAAYNRRCRTAHASLILPIARKAGDGHIKKQMPFRREKAPFAALQP